MSKTVIGLFDNYSQAESAVRELETSGIPRNDISLIASNTSGQFNQYATTLPTPASDTTADSTVQGAETGAAIGAIGGGSLGFLAGLGLLAIPGFGPIAATGWLLAMLTGAGIGAATGAVAGGLIGALVGVGVPQEQAELYQEGVRRGGTLVAVRADESFVERVATILSKNGAIDIDERGASWRQFDTMGTTTTPMVATAPASQGNMTAESGHVSRSRSEDAYEADFRNHFQTNYGNRGWKYENYDPAYRYGWDLANDPRYQGRDWNTIEPEIRREWESRSPGSWEMFMQSIRYAWDKATGAERGGIKTGGHALDGTPDTRGITEKVADAVTGDRIDDKTGKRVS